MPCYGSCADTTSVLSTRTTSQAARTTAPTRAAAQTVRTTAAASRAYPSSNTAAATTASTSVEHNVWVRYAGSHDTKSVSIRWNVKISTLRDGIAVQS